MIVAGLGCRKGTSTDAVLSALDAACTQAGILRSDVTALATGEIKREEPGIVDLARQLGLPLHVLDDDALKQAEPRTSTVSKHSLANTVSPSLSEASALSGAGETSELLVTRVIANGATCALARSASRSGNCSGNTP